MVVLGQLFEQLFFGSVHRGGHMDIHDHQQVAASVTVHIRNAFSAQSQHFAGLRARFDFNFGLRVNRRHLHRSAERSLREGNIQIVNQIVPVANEILVGFLFDQHEQVAVHAAVTRGIAFAADRPEF